MRALLVILLASSCAWTQQLHDIIRPSRDLDGGSYISTHVDTTDCPTALQTGSSAQPNWWDAAGLSTSSLFELTNGNPNVTRCANRVFDTFPAGTHTYSSLILFVNSSGTCAHSCGIGTIAYSANGNVSFTTLISGANWVQATFSANLSLSQDLTQLTVSAVDFANTNLGGGTGQGDMAITGFDVWVDGAYNPPAAITGPTPTVSQPVLISKATWKCPLWILWFSGRLW